MEYIQMNLSLPNLPDNLLHMTTSHAFISVYHPGAQNPIMIRHYNHMHTDPAGNYGYPTRKMDTYTFFIFLEGNLHLMIQDSIYTPSCSDIIFLRKGEPYALFFHSFSRVEYYEIDFPGDFFKYIPQNSPFHKYFEERAFGCRNMLSLSDLQKNTMFHLLRKLENQMTDQPTFSEYLNYATLLELCVLLGKAYTDTPETVSVKSVPALREAIIFIQANYLTISSTTKIAQHCHISVSYLCRLFKKHLNMSPIDYMNSHKLAHARYLLKNGANTTEACYGSGFSNYNYFITTFKKYTGQTPSQFRKHSADPL